MTSSALARRGVGLAGLAVVAVLIFSVPAWGGGYDLLVAYEIAQLAALALAWNVMAGYGGLVSLAVAAFVGIGGYATAKLSISAGFPLIPSILVGGVFAVAFAVLVSVPMFRFRGLYFTIGSLVLASALGVFMVNYNGLGGNAGLTFTDTAPTATQLYDIAAACAVIAMVGTALVIRGRLGLGLMAVRDDEDVAERVGVATFRTKLVSFVLSAFVIGLIGGLQAQKLGHIEPYGSFSLNWTINAVNAAIVGGIGTIVGPVVGSVIVIELQERLANHPETHLMIIGALLIVIIRFAPAGIWGTILRFGAPRLRGVLPEWLWPRSAGAALGEAPLEEPAQPHELETAPGARAAVERPAAGTVLLRAAGVGKNYGGVQAVEAVDMEIRSGEILGIIGPNGAGKSTLIGLLSGAIEGDGAVEMFGEDVSGVGAQGRARRGIGRTHQVPRPFGRLTVMENLLVAQMHGAGRGRTAARAEAARILVRCGLADYADVPAVELGLLRLKRLELARALATHPRILLLDEIGAGLIETEVAELIELINALRDEVEAIVVVEHILDVIRETCDRAVVIDRGRKLTEGTPHEVLGDPQVAAVYLGTSGGEEIAHARVRSLVSAGGQPLLEVRGIAAQYGAFRALQEVSFSIGAGEVLALLGSNGAGKTTTARAVSGQLPITAGEILLEGKRVDGRGAHNLVRMGVAHCMEGRRIFGDLTVEENLLLGGRSAESKAEREKRLGEVYELFDALRERRGNSGAELSGGQQQMLAIGRALMARPRLVLFDEISLGLAPITVDRLYEALAEINGRGVAMVVIEQNVERGLALADHVAVLEKGRVALTGTPDEVRRDPRLVSLYVGEAKGVAA